MITGANGFVGREIVKSFDKCEDVSLVLILRFGQKEYFAGNPKVMKIYETTDLFKEQAEWWERVCLDVDASFTVHGTPRQENI